MSRQYWRFITIFLLVIALINPAGFVFADAANPSDAPQEIENVLETKEVQALPVEEPAEQVAPDNVPDTEKPFVTDAFPANGAQNVSVTDKTIFLLTNEPVFVNGQNLTRDNTRAKMSLTYNGTQQDFLLAYNSSTKLLQLTVQPGFIAQSQYLLTIQPDTFRDAAGNPNDLITLGFTTGVDNTPPGVSFDPMNGSVSMPVDGNIMIHFTKPVTPVSTSYQSFVTLREYTPNSPTGTYVAYSTAWSNNGRTLVLDPAQDLLPNKTYLVSVNAGFVRDNLNQLNNAAYATFTTIGDSLPPTFTLAIVPTASTAAVPSYSNFTVTVSEAVTLGNGEAITDATAGNVVRLKDYTGRIIPTRVMWAPYTRTFTIDPVNNLRSSTNFTLEVVSGTLKDTAGNLNSTATLAFTTMYEQGPPIITSSIMNGQINVSPAEPIVLFFNKSVVLANGSAITNDKVGQLISLKEMSGVNAAYTATWDPDQLSITITPISKLKTNTTYIVSMEGNAFKDLAGSSNQAYRIQFTTVSDLNQPTVISAPENGEKAVPVNSKIHLRFSKPVVLPNGQKITDSKVKDLVTVKDSNLRDVAFTGQWIEDERIIALTPTSPLKRNEAYTIQVKEAAVKDQTNTPVQGYIASFNTIMDTNLPEIISLPAHGDEVAVDEEILIAFKEEVKLANNRTITLATVRSLAKLYDEEFKLVSVGYSWDAKNRTIKLKPRNALKASSTYTLIIPGAKVYNTKRKGNAAYVATFTTSGESLPPQIEITPKDGSTKVGIRQNIEVRFDRTVTMANGTELSDARLKDAVQLYNDDAELVPVDITWDEDRKVIVIDPKLNYRRKSTYFVMIPEGTFCDLVGNLNEEMISTFETASE
ncbi:Ig-like domain-containing protein [Brevibacillus dissolubilis]|uniref:Ig-like domain-containing protein n=1 Tax=Brevibacillus dissolubilis TaxID=1844116 RepID=UPI001116C9F8|nr:Ig-like domain-containing protein [Brevibacillus dissolubilis]